MVHGLSCLFWFYWLFFECGRLHVYACMIAYVFMWRPQIGFWCLPLLLFIYVCVPCMCLVPVEDKRGKLVPLTGIANSYKSPHGCLRVLGSSRRIASALNHPSSPTPNSFLTQNLSVKLEFTDWLEWIFIDPQGSFFLFFPSY